MTHLNLDSARSQLDHSCATADAKGILLIHQKQLSPKHEIPTSGATLPLDMQMLDYTMKESEYCYDGATFGSDGGRLSMSGLQVKIET